MQRAAKTGNNKRKIHGTFTSWRLL